MNLDPNDIIALLEDGPKHEATLIGWLDQPMAVVTVTLKELLRAGQVKRVGFERKWALITHVAPVGRPHLAKGATPPARALRQPGQPAAEAVKIDVAPSWWVGLDRADLNVEAQQRVKAMSASKMANRVTGTGVW